MEYNNTSASYTESVEGVDLDRWPRLRHALTVDDQGRVECDYFAVIDRVEFRRVPAAEKALIWEDMAEFYEWRLKSRAAELARDHSRRRMVERWTDSMCYSLRRSAIFTRGGDPGPVIPQSERRPDLFGYRWDDDGPRDQSSVDLAG